MESSVFTLERGHHFTSPVMFHFSLKQLGTVIPDRKPGVMVVRSLEAGCAVENSMSAK